MTDPRERWPLPEHAQVAERLLAAYGAPERGYHDLRHLTEVLDRVAELLPATDGAVDRDAVMLAAWFHDAVYEAARDDEERSAELARQELAGVGADPGLVEEVVRLVRTTARHRPDPDDVAGQVLCDADLAILAAGPDRYRDYVAGVRKEFAALPDAEFREGRATVLRDLLAKPALFHTARGRSLWEDAARENMRRELEALDAVD